MKAITMMLALLACVCLGGEETPVIPVTIRAQAELAVFKAGGTLPVSITLTNGLPTVIRFGTFATEPNEWNGEAMNISLVDVYRDGQQRNLYLARPKVTPPVNISGMGSYPIPPGGTLRVTVDISKWTIQGAWMKGTYELVFRMDNINVGDKVTMSVLSDPIRCLVR